MDVRVTIDALLNLDWRRRSKPMPPRPLATTETLLYP